MDLEEFRTKLFGMCGLATVEKAFELYSELEAENERLKAKNNWLFDELKQTESHDKIVIDGLRKENERLKGENAKLKCWALHLSENYFIVWAAYFYKLRKRKRAKRIEDLSEKYGVAYREAKKKLKEGSNA